MTNYTSLLLWVDRFKQHQVIIEHPDSWAKSLVDEGALSQSGCCVDPTPRPKKFSILHVFPQR